MPAHLHNFLYYAGIIVLIGGFIVGVVLALRARRDAREGVELTSDAEMIAEFQRARDAGEMDEAEFRRVRDLLISGRGTREEEQRDTGPNSGSDGRPPVVPTPESPASTGPQGAPSNPG